MFNLAPAGLGQPYGGAAFSTSYAYGGIPVTVQRMTALVLGSLQREQSMALRKLAEDILTRVRPKDGLSEVAAIHYWMIQNSRYTLDPVHMELLKAPVVTLTKSASDAVGGRRAGAIDCDECSEAEAALNMVVGRRCSFFTVSMEANREDHHVFTVVRLPVGVSAGRPVELKLVVDPVPGPYVAEMLKRVVTWHEWPIEPVSYSNGSWGPAVPTFAGAGMPPLQVIR